MAAASRIIGKFERDTVAPTPAPSRPPKPPARLQASAVIACEADPGLPRQAGPLSGGAEGLIANTQDIGPALAGKTGSRIARN